MDKLIIKGSFKISGSVNVHGSKNAALPIIVSSLLSEKTLKLSNVPNVVDVLNLIKLLKNYGVKIEYNKDKLKINPKKIKNLSADYDVVRKMRASILILGPLLSRFGEARISLPGGCAIGTRPIDIHLEALSKLGVEYKIIDGYVHATAPNGLNGTKINFSRISVGATENLIIAASHAKGTTVLNNCAIEPEIKDLVKFLVKLGCNIKWISKRSIKIIGVRETKQTTYKVMFDRIEAGTYLIAAAITRGNLKIKNIIPDIIKTEIAILKKIGAKIHLKKNEIHIIGNSKIKSLNIKTSPYPGVATDIQAQLMVLFALHNNTINCA